MRLSDVKGDRVFEVLAEVIEPVRNLSSDKDISALFEGSKSDGRDGFSKRLLAAVPTVVRKHKDDVVAILAAIEGVSPKDYEASLTMSKLLGDVFQLLTDKDLPGFLSSEEASGHGSTSETTED